MHPAFYVPPASRPALGRFGIRKNFLTVNTPSMRLGIVPPQILQTEGLLFLSGVYRDYAKALVKSGQMAHILRLKQIKAIVFLSNWSRLFSEKLFPLADIADKIHVIPPATERCGMTCDSVPNTAYKPLRILTIGNNWTGKGYPLSARIIEHVHQAGINYEWRIHSNSVPHDFRKQSEVQVLDSTRMSDTDRCAAWHWADIFLFPCVADSWGVYLEAVAHGVPIIGTRPFDKKEFFSEGCGGHFVDSPIELFGPNFLREWKTWGEFESAFNRHLSAGTFNRMTASLARSIVDIAQNPGHLRALRKASFDTAEKCFSVRRRSDAFAQLSVHSRKTVVQ